MKDKINKIRQNMLLIFCFVSTIMLTSSCDSQQYNDNELLHNEMRLSLSLLKMDGDTTSSKTRSIESFKNITHYILDENHEIVESIKHIYEPSTSEIIIDNVYDGNYFLIALAHNSDNENINIYKINQITDKWISNSNLDEKSIKDELFYVKHPFQVSNGEVIQSKVALKRIVARFNFNLDFNNYEVERNVESIEFIPDEMTFSNTFHADNKYSGEHNFNPISLLEQRTILLFPTNNAAKFSGKIKITWKKEGNEVVVKQYTFTSDVQPNKLYNINLKIDHPQRNFGLTIVKKTDYNESNFYRILQDDEHKDVYCDRNQRYFHIVTPLQVSLNNEQKLHLRFYSPVGIKNIQIFAKLKNSKHQIELFQIDEIPDFADITIPVNLTLRNAVYKTREGLYVSINKITDLKPEDIEFEIVCDDPYMKKIKEIRAKWSIFWSLYRGNPDLPDGGQNGNWKGIRPVHVRESIAIMTNIAYMYSLPELEQAIFDYAGEDGIRDDNGKQIDRSIIIPRILNLSIFNMGLTTNAGLGGGSTFGINQQGYFLHYFNPTACMFTLHELMHCAGWMGHVAAGIATGPITQVIANHFYVNNLGRFPVYSSIILNSTGNPNKY